MIGLPSALRRLLKLLPAALFFVVFQARAGEATSTTNLLNETPARHDARMKWFREARFGLFIHWGLYSQAAGEWNGKQTDGAGEWIMNDRQIPDSQYASLVPQFNPVKFDARQWVEVARSAGVKYIVITSKHHEGFGMYPSALTDWCIKSTPFGRDPLKELSQACPPAGIKLCFYHSIMDWHHPDYLPRKPWNDEASPNPDFDQYVTYLKGQLKELLTGYGPIGIVWFDGQWEKTWTYDRGVDLYNYVRNLQPATIVNNRVGHETPGRPAVGDYGTPEQFIPASGYGPGVDWETCMTMNGTWGFKTSDHNWKSSETLIHNLVDICSKGGNYLLNVGPTSEGLIPAESVERLQAIGRWMDINGEAIYGTTASPFNHQLPWGRCTKKVNGRKTTLYLHVFDWPVDGQLIVPGLKSRPKNVWLLDRTGKKSLVSTMTDDGLAVTVPRAAPDLISSTIMAQFTKPLEIAPGYITPQGDGSFMLSAGEARLHGNTIRYEEGRKRDNIGFWVDPQDWVDWFFKLRTPGRFAVTAQIAAVKSASFDISINGETLHCTTPATGDYTKFKSVDFGVANISKSGLLTLSVQPVRTGWQAMNLKFIQLKPLPGTP